MIERLQVIATHLHRFRLLLALVALLSFAILLLSVLDDPWIEDDALLIPSILCFTWAVTLFSCSRLFTHIPQRPSAGTPWRTRLAFKVRYAIIWLLALLILGLCGALLILTYQLLRIGTVG